MPIRVVAARPTDALFKQSREQISVLDNGVFYDQYGATAAIASTTAATSMFNNSSTTVVVGGPLASDQKSQLVLPKDSIQVGTIIRGYLVGTIANTSTPNLTIDAGLTTQAGVYTALASTGATAMSNVSTSDFQVDFEFMVRSIGSAGVIFAKVSYRYGTTSVFKATGTNTVDTTVPYTIDSQLTWGTSSSSNTATIQYAVVEVVC